MYILCVFKNTEILQFVDSVLTYDPAIRILIRIWNVKD